MEKNIRVVVVGCGNMGSSHARSYHMLPGFDLVGVVDSSQEKRETLASELGVTPFASLEAAIEKANPEAVAICTYPDTHADFASRALRAGLHVFVEKPVAETVEQAQQVVALAKTDGQKGCGWLYLAASSCVDKIYRYGSYAWKTACHANEFKSTEQGRRMGCSQTTDEQHVTHCRLWCALRGCHVPDDTQ